MAQKNTENHHLSIDLITIGPGPYYWEAFGHSALRVRSGDQDYMFGFGYFDFEEEDFFLKFARGQMRYFLGVEDAQYELDNYRLQGRHVWSQPLIFSSEQKNELVSELNQLMTVNNRYYQYDYFLNNCTSRIRDMLDDLLNHQVSPILNGQQTVTSWSEVTFPAANQAWMNLGMALGYGLPAYQLRNEWQLNVFPMRFAQTLDSIKARVNWVGSRQTLFEPTIESENFNKYDFFKTHYAVLLCVAVFLLPLLFNVSRSAAIYTWLTVEAVVGILVVMLWLMTDHSVAAQNINVLLFFPFSFILFIKKWRSDFVLLMFGMIKVLWLLFSIFVTHWYLIGFFVISLLVLLSLRHQRSKC